MSDSIPRLRTTRRHPSAGNLDSRPALVREGEPPAPLPPASFPHGAEQSGTGAVRLGPDLDDAALGRLIGAAGPIEGRRRRDLGYGAGAAPLEHGRPRR